MEQVFRLTMEIWVIALFPPTHPKLNLTSLPDTVTKSHPLSPLPKCAHYKAVKILTIVQKPKYFIVVTFAPMKMLAAPPIHPFKIVPVPRCLF